MLAKLIICNASYLGSWSRILVNSRTFFVVCIRTRMEPTDYTDFRKKDYCKNELLMIFRRSRWSWTTGSSSISSRGSSIPGRKAKSPTSLVREALGYSNQSVNLALTDFTVVGNIRLVPVYNFRDWTEVFCWLFETAALGLTVSVLD